MAGAFSILLKTERMYLRQFQTGDASLLFELDSDSEVMRFITKGRPTPLAKIQDEVLPRFLGYYLQSPSRGFWAAHLSETDEFIGWFHLRPDRIVPEELGYRLKRSVWGRGLATEGSQALLQKAFGEWGLKKSLCADDGLEPGVVAGHGEGRPDFRERIFLRRGGGAGLDRARGTPGGEVLDHANLTDKIAPAGLNRLIKPL
jgi:hypothetical protein